MADTNPDESLDADGIPDVEDHPPGMDVELDQEAVVAPREYPIAAGDDPAYPVTAAEERSQESVGERAARETPDVGADELGVGGGVTGTEAAVAGRPLREAGGPPLGEFSTGGGAGETVPAIDDPVREPLADEVVPTEDAGTGQLSGAGPGEEGDGELEGTQDDQELGEGAGDRAEVALAPEESAVEVEGDDGVR